MYEDAQRRRCRASTGELLCLSLQFEVGSQKLGAGKLRVQSVFSSNHKTQEVTFAIITHVFYCCVALIHAGCATVQLQHTAEKLLRNY